MSTDGGRDFEPFGMVWAPFVEQFVNRCGAQVFLRVLLEQAFEITAVVLLRCQVDLGSHDPFNQLSSRFNATIQIDASDQ